MIADVRALIVDDEKDIRALVSMALERIDICCEQAADVAEAKQMLETQAYHFCITDMKLPDGDGLQLIQHCNRRYPDMPIAMITAFGNLEVGVNALKSGAFDVVAKPLDIQQLRSIATAALRLSKVEGNVPEQCMHQLVGESEVIQTLRANVRKVSRTQAPVMIYGETGTGKECIARGIHAASSRADAPFLVIDCQALEPQDAPAKLFGYTQSDGQVHDGYVHQANGGTLFLNNVEYLTPDTQAGLLQLLTDRKVRAIDARDEKDLDIRFISATSTNLQHRCDRGEFRSDLLFRLKVVQLDVPPLRSRPEDIPALTEQLIQSYAQQWDMPVVSISADALDSLLQQSLPGNIRELDAILQRAFTLMEGEEIQLTDLNFEPQAPEHGYHSHSEAMGDLEGYLEKLEREAIEEALLATRWNKTAAAEKLGISFRALRYRCKKLEID